MQKLAQRKTDPLEQEQSRPQEPAAPQVLLYQVQAQ